VKLLTQFTTFISQTAFKEEKLSELNDIELADQSSMFSGSEDENADSEDESIQQILEAVPIVLN